MFTYDKRQAGPFILTTDFSAKGMSAILSQVQNGKERLIACSGRKCTPPEQSYASIKGELAAIIYGLRKYESFLRYNTHFFLVTDSACIRYLATMKTSSKLF